MSQCGLIRNVICAAIIVLIGTTRCFAALSTEDAQFLTSQCQFRADDIAALLTLPKGGQEKFSALVKVKSCEGFVAFQATRQYVRKFQTQPPPTSISRAPKDYDRDFVSDKEFEAMKSVVDSFANDLARTVISITPQEMESVKEALMELQPPATLAEAVLFKNFKHDQAEIDGFIATRKYLRQIGFPGKITVPPSEAPPVPKGVDYKYTLDFDEEFPLFQIFLSQGISGTAR